MTGIDVHTHALHPKIAHKVVAQLHDHYGVKPAGIGTIEHLLERERAAGIDEIVVFCAATAPAQVIPANNWIMSIHAQYPEVNGYGTLHPDYEDWEKELDRLEAAGIKGLKFHPEFQSFWMDSPKLMPIIEEAQDRFFLIFHVGDRLPPEKNPSCPFKMAKLMKNFPRARFIAAHLGGFQQWNASMEALIGKQVYIDTSSSLPFLDDVTLRTIWNRHPRELVLFGSDYPLFDPVDSLEELQTRLNLPDHELDEVLHNGFAVTQKLGSKDHALSERDVHASGGLAGNF